ncbi:hypothetical protein CMI37_17995 [Candidatus Pacearchaeota archaeon]|nr:hypothetical protein [Candidatus Pacearchaeota archaeon]|tara:strand:- start:167 stop:418 length:252 start_codon:yes stop_codon:yes gene_type:complete
MGKESEQTGDKPTWKSTEFWISLVGVIGGIVMAVLPDSPSANIVGGILAAICGSSYTLGRSVVKGNAEKAKASVALLDAARKK